MNVERPNMFSYIIMVIPSGVMFLIVKKMKKSYIIIKTLISIATAPTYE